MKTLIFIVLFISSGALFAQSTITGYRTTSKKDAVVEIYKKNGKVYGKIIRVNVDANNPNKNPLDKENPDANLKKRPLVGINVLMDLKKSGNDEWEDGSIYDPKNGKTYSCKAKLKNGKLEIRGFVGMSMFGRTEIWERVKK